MHTRTEVLVGLFSEEMFLTSQQLARQLRGYGMKVEAVLQPQKLAKQYQYADKKGIQLVVMVGPDEAEAGQATIKDMSTGQQQTVNRNELIPRLQLMLE